MNRSNLLLSIAFAALALVSILALAFRTDSSGGWGQVALGALTVASVALVSNTLASLWARKPRSRAASLGAQRPSAIVVQSGRIGGLQAFLKIDGAIDPVLYITALIENEGISLWRNYSPPKIWTSVDAGQIVGVDVERFVESGRSRYRLRFSMQTGNLLLPVLGEGVIGMMSPTLSEVESLAESARTTLELS